MSQKGLTDKMFEKLLDLAKDIKVIKVERFMTSERKLLELIPGQGGDYINDWISVSKYPGYWTQEISDEDAEKLAAVSGYAFSDGKMGNKEFVRIEDGRFLSKWDGTYTLYNFFARGVKCKFCSHAFVYEYCAACHRKHEE